MNTFISVALWVLTCGLSKIRSNPSFKSCSPGVLAGRFSWVYDSGKFYSLPWSSRTWLRFWWEVLAEVSCSVPHGCLQVNGFLNPFYDHLDYGGSRVHSRWMRMRPSRAAGLRKLDLLLHLPPYLWVSLCRYLKKVRWYKRLGQQDQEIQVAGQDLTDSFVLRWSY